jgi:glycerol uptake facilitator protein
MSAFWAEFMGTFLLLFVGNGVVANVVLKQTKAAGDPGSWIMITTAWGLAVYIGVVVAGPYSGAHLNPAVSLALWLNTDLTTSQLGTYVLAQLLGAAAGTTLNYFFYKPHYDITENGAAIRGSFCTSPSFDKTWNNFLSEAMGAFVLVFVVFYISPASLEADPSIPIGLGSVGALPVGLLVWVIGLGLGGTTGYAINPARDLGPRIMHQLLPIKHKIDSGWSYAWIPVCAPLAGAALAWWIKELLLTTAV